MSKIHPNDYMLCSAKVTDENGEHRCTRRRWKDGVCRIHHPDYKPEPRSNSGRVKELEAEIERLKAELAEYEASFNLRWKADMRAIQRWKAKTGRESVWPDHADLVVWLIDQQDELAKTYSTLPKLVADAERDACIAIASKHIDHGEFVHGGRNECPEAIVEELKFRKRLDAPAV